MLDHNATAARQTVTDPERIGTAMVATRCPQGPEAGAASAGARTGQAVPVEALRPFAGVDVVVAWKGAAEGLVARLRQTPLPGGLWLGTVAEAEPDSLWRCRFVPTRDPAAAEIAIPRLLDLLGNSMTWVRVMRVTPRSAGGLTANAAPRGGDWSLRPIPDPLGLPVRTGAYA